MKKYISNFFNRKNNIYYLDGLRALAIIQVIFYNRNITFILLFLAILSLTLILCLFSWVLIEYPLIRYSKKNKWSKKIC